MARKGGIERDDLKREWKTYVLFKPSISQASVKNNSMVFYESAWFSVFPVLQRVWYVDGHEQRDVVEYRETFLKKIATLEKDHKPPPPCEDGIHPYPIGSSDRAKHLVFIYHDESSFHANGGKTSGWHEKGKWPLLPKDAGKGIMATDFVDEFNGYLWLNEKETKGYRFHLQVII